MSHNVKPISFSDIWGESADSVYLSGPGHQGYESVYHWDGFQWTPVQGTSEWSSSRIFGYSSDDFWVTIGLGYVSKWNGNDWEFFDLNPTFGINYAWGPSSDDIYFGTEYGQLHHFDGNNWQHYYVDSDLTGSNFKSLWGTGASNVFAAGNLGILYRYDGTEWSNNQVGPVDNFTGIWHSGNDEIIAVGENGVIVRWSTSDWEYLDSHVTSDLNDIWGVDNVAIAVGDNGIILNWDGSDWTTVPSGTTEDLNCIRGLPGGNIFTVGENGTILKFLNGEWQPESPGIQVDWNGVWVSGENDVYAVGDRYQGDAAMYHWDGIEWSKIENVFYMDLYDIYGFASDDIYATGYGPWGGQQALHYDGTGWIDYDLEHYPLSLMFSIGGSRDQVYFGGGNLLLSFDGENWTQESKSFPVRDIYTTQNGQTYFAGFNGLIMSGEYLNPCQNTGVSISMPSDMYVPGRIFSCGVSVCNNTGNDIAGFPLFVILDVYGSLYFAPEFTETPSNYLYDYPIFPVGKTYVSVIDAFQWPENVGSAQNIYWYAAMTSADVTEIIGDWDSFAFGWSE